MEACPPPPPNPTPYPTPTPTPTYPTPNPTPYPYLPTLLPYPYLPYLPYPPTCLPTYLPTYPPRPPRGSAPASGLLAGRPGAAMAEKCARAWGMGGARGAGEMGEISLKLRAQVSPATLTVRQPDPLTLIRLTNPGNPNLSPPYKRDDRQPRECNARILQPAPKQASTVRARARARARV